MKRALSFLLLFTLFCPVSLAAEAPQVSAASAVVMDVDTGRVLYEKDAHTRRLIASTTKLMTALVAVESTPDLDKIIQVKAEYQAEGSSMYLRVGEELTLRDLLYGLLLTSGNDAALAIAGGCAGDVETFVGWMNRRAEELGMRDTHFANPNGLDDEEHYASAYDMALLGREFMNNQVLAEIAATRSATAAGRSLVNHNKLLWRYEGCTGLKTGYTDAAGRTLVSSAERSGQRLVCVTLNDRDDWNDHMALLDYCFETYPIFPLARAGKVFRTLPVTGSLVSRVDVVTAADMAYPLREEETVRARITLPDLVKAPLERGAVAGKLTFLLGEEVVGETYLLYAADVPDNTPRPTLLSRVKGLLLHREEGAAAALFALDRGREV